MSQQINLFKPVFLKQRKYFSVIAMGQALALIVLGSGLFYGYAMYQVDQLSRQAADMTKRYAAEQARLTNYANEFSPQRSGQLLQDELAQLEAQAAAQNVLLTTLKSGVIGNTEGYSEYMRAFARQSIHGLCGNSATDVFAVGQSGTILKTTDSGNNWITQVTGTTRNLYAVHFVSHLLGWTVGYDISNNNSVILKTTDGGSNWTFKNSGTNRNLYSVHFVDDLNGWTVGAAGTILVTQDGRNNWSSQSSPFSGQLSGLNFVDDTTGWIVGENGLS